MKKTAVFFAPGFEEIEALTVVDVLRRADIETLMVSVGDDLLVEGSHRIAVRMDTAIAALDFSGIDMIILPGGPGVAALEACAPLMEQVDAFHAAQKPLAAICAAPGILGRRGILAGRAACSYPSVEGDLRGATVGKEAAIRDGHIITARGMGCSVDFALAIVAFFQGQEATRELAEKIIFNA